MKNSYEFKYRIITSITIILYFFVLKVKISPAATPIPKTLTILSFNILRLPNAKRFKQIKHVIRESNADIVGLQEAWSKVGPLATALKYNSNGRAQVLSRFPISKKFFSKYVTLKITDTFHLALANIHLNHSNYGPYGIRDGKTVKDVIATESSLRASPLNKIIQSLNSSGENIQSFIILGDFNAPSHLDWTIDQKPNHFNKVVNWPTSVLMKKMGYVDSYRRYRHDLNLDRGYTWTSKKNIKNEVHDRIDYIFYKNSENANHQYKLELQHSEVYGEDGEHSDQKFEDWPSDHRAVLSSFKIIKR